MSTFLRKQADLNQPYYRHSISTLRLVLVLVLAPLSVFSFLTLSLSACFLCAQRRARKAWAIARMCLVVVVEMHHKQVLEVRKQKRWKAYIRVVSKLCGKAQEQKGATNTRRGRKRQREADRRTIEVCRDKLGCPSCSSLFSHSFVFTIISLLFIMLVLKVATSVLPFCGVARIQSLYPTEFSTQQGRGIAEETVFEEEGFAPAMALHRYFDISTFS